MSILDSVVPNSLNYTDMKPQSIFNNIKLVKFQPTATVTGAKGGDMVKFMLSGNGFLDPYSTYLQFTVEVDDLLANEIRTVDRSAHSFIQRIVIRSQGIELERMDNYDVVAAMINDMIYSPEQCALHYWEGFPTHQVAPTRHQTGELLLGEPPGCDSRDLVLKLLSQGSSPSIINYLGETSFHNLEQLNNAEQARPVNAQGQAQNATANGPCDFSGLNDLTLASELVGRARPDKREAGDANTSTYVPFSFGYHEGGRRIPTGYSPVANSPVLVPRGTTKMQFIVPIYSGIIGLLMPEKRLVPLNLLPLDIEIVFNPHALYSNRADGKRNYKITQFNMFAHMLFFEQEIHRTLEAAVADHGLFIYCNSFHSTPQSLIATEGVPSVSYISMNLKSINSVHTVFMYNHFETKPCARKLHFVSHNLKSLFLVNGTENIPQYPIEGMSGSSNQGQHMPFVVELYKAWNKMHDPTTDGAISAYNYCGDQYNNQFDPFVPVLTSYIESERALEALMNRQGLVGRCQYGISLEGEELGTDHTMITGRKSQYPFLLQMSSDGKCSSHTSYMQTYLRADYIIFVRPDLQIVTLGK